MDSDLMFFVYAFGIGFGIGIMPAVIATIVAAVGVVWVMGSIGPEALAYFGLMGVFALPAIGAGMLAAWGAKFAFGRMVTGKREG